jgi:hypothetical protein
LRGRSPGGRRARTRAGRRRHAGAEIDLLGFRLACETVHPERRFVVYGGVERFPLAEGVEAVSLVDLCEELSGS